LRSDKVQAGNVGGEQPLTTLGLAIRIPISGRWKLVIFKLTISSNNKQHFAINDEIGVDQDGYSLRMVSVR
jgi:hypothetical protein